MIKKNQVANYLLMQAFGKDTPALENFEVQRYGSKKPSKIALLVLDLLNYLDFRRISAVVTEGLEVWTMITADDYAMTMVITETERACSSRPEPNHKVVKKIKVFLEKNEFVYKGMNTMPTPRYEFRKGDIVFMLDKEKLIKQGGNKDG